MAISKACWGIDVGQCALKALKLRQSGGELEAVSFDVIEHAKILSQPDADEQQLIRNALDKFLSRNSVKNDLIVVAVPGQASFSRFIKLPPVELKKVPEIVRYEARQQIPFNLDEVIWQHQVMALPTGGPAEIEVGIFAMKRDIVQDYVNDFTQVKIVPDIMQMAPVALYNYLRYDRREGAGATLLVDVGAENTSLVIADGYRVWIRNFPLGGNNFTQALVKAFKLTFGKAENLKRHAAESKHAREVFQAMRPVFSDLLTEIQRSIGFYTSLHRESRIERVLAMGNTFRLAGLQKFLSQNLGVDVIKVEQFNTLRGDQVVSAPVFKENVLSFGVAFGLALQGLGLGAITTTLLPPEILKAKELKRKRPFVAAAAVAVIVGFGLMAWDARKGVEQLNPAKAATIGSLEEAAQSKKQVLTKVAAFEEANAQLGREFQANRDALVAKQKELDEYLTLGRAAVPLGRDGRPLPGPDGKERLMQYRDVWYWVLYDVWDSLPKDPAFAEYKADEDKDFLVWRDLKAVEVLKIWGEYDEIVKAEAGAPGTPGPTGRPSLGGVGAEAKRGTPVLVVRLEGTAPKASSESGAKILMERLGRRLQEKGYFQRVHQSGGEESYRNAPGYPYEKEKPQPAGAVPGAGEEGAVPGMDERPVVPVRPPSGVTSRAAGAEQKMVNPWRGEDYWFQLTWYVNLEDVNAKIDFTGYTDRPTTPEGYGPGPDYRPGEFGPAGEERLFQ